jgi:hypothetical protein
VLARLLFRLAASGIKQEARESTQCMKALFADLSARERERHQYWVAHHRDERRRVLALCDAVQISVANGQHDRATMLLAEMHRIVDVALGRRRGIRTRVTARSETCEQS